MFSVVKRILAPEMMYNSCSIHAGKGTSPICLLKKSLPSIMLWQSGVQTKVVVYILFELLESLKKAIFISSKIA